MLDLFWRLLLRLSRTGEGHDAGRAGDGLAVKEQLVAYDNKRNLSDSACEAGSVMMKADDDEEEQRTSLAGPHRWRWPVAVLAVLALAACASHLYSFHYADLVIVLEHLFPSPRKSCLWTDRERPSALPSPRIASPRIAILILNDDQRLEARFTEMEQSTVMSIQNKRAYCALHGYTLLLADGHMIDRSRPAAWSKVLALRHFLPSYDWIVYMDTDTLVMNPDIKIETLIDERYDVVISEDWNGVNTGVFLTRNSTWSWWLLDELWKQRQLVSGYYPFEYEQRAFHLLLQTPLWRARGLEKYHGASEIRQHFKIIPQCAMNSYMLSPFRTLTGASVTTSQYVPGDFVVHMAGYKDRKSVV